jgi:hypothetical protein
VIPLLIASLIAAGVGYILGVEVVNCKRHDETNQRSRCIRVNAWYDVLSLCGRWPLGFTGNCTRSAPTIKQYYALVDARLISLAVERAYGGAPC